MLHVRVVAPKDTCDSVAALIRDDPTTANLAVIRGVTLDGAGDLLLFDVARENANGVIDALRGLGIEESGSIALTETATVISRAADAADLAAPGLPSDGVVWEEVEAGARRDARLSWTFLTFLTLATLIAGIGRYLDQPILIIGAMVVGPEFAPLAALCVAVVRRQRGIAGPAALTLFGGFAIAAAIAWLVWSVVAAFGLLDVAHATTGRQTAFIIEPTAWSFVIALLAGAAGVLSLISDKSSALVGVFISITTVPAVGTIGLTLAVGAWGEATASTVQLAVNLLGLFVGGIITLFIAEVASRARSARSRRLAGSRRNTA